MIKLLEMFGIHKNIARSTEKGGDDPLWVRERRVRVCKDESTKRLVQHHRCGRCLVGTVASLVLDKGPAKSQCHKGHSRGPCPTASPMMFQLLSVLQ